MYVVSAEDAALSITRTYAYAAREIPPTYFNFTAEHFAIVVHLLLCAYVDTLKAFPYENDLAVYVERKMRQNISKKCSRDRSVNLNISYGKIYAGSIFTRAWIENMNDADVRSLLKSMISRYCADGCPDDAYAWGYRVFRDDSNIKSSASANNHPNAIHLRWEPDDVVAQAIQEGVLKKETVVNILHGFFVAATEVALWPSIPAKHSNHYHFPDNDSRMECPVRRR